MTLNQRIKPAGMQRVFVSTVRLEAKFAPPKTFKNLLTPDVLFSSKPMRRWKASKGVERRKKGERTLPQKSSPGIYFFDDKS